MAKYCKWCRTLLIDRVNHSSVCDGCHSGFAMWVFVIGLAGGAVIALIVKWGLGL